MAAVTEVVTLPLHTYIGPYFVSTTHHHGIDSAVTEVTMYEVARDGTLLGDGGNRLNVSMGFFLYAMVLCLAGRGRQTINVS